MKKIAALLSIFIILISSVSVFAEGEPTSINFIQNGGFEDDLKSWEQSPVNKAQGITKFLVDTAQKHSGSKSFCIDSSSPNSAVLIQKVKVKPQTRYKLSCWLKTENVGKEDKGAYIMLKTKSTSVTSMDTKGTSGEWVYMDDYLDTLKGEDEMEVYLGLGGSDSLNKGKVWFDDVVFEDWSLIKTSSDPNNPNDANNQQPSKPAASAGSNYTYIVVGIVAMVVVLVAYMMFKPKKSKK